MPKTGANIQRIAFLWFVGHAGDDLTAKSRSEAQPPRCACWPNPPRALKQWN